MSCIDSFLVRNGDDYVKMYVYKCDCCGIHMQANYSMYLLDENTHNCPECAFKNGLINEVEYCDNCGGINSSMFAAGINPQTNEIELVKGSTEMKRHIIDGKYKYKRTRTKRGTFSWELTDKQLNKRQRGSEQYQTWRTDVFKRDNYTCQHCNKLGGELNAHHIKCWKDYKKLRFKIENGITLCLECHKVEHKKLRGK